ncbi:hypothetical protein NKI79_15030 [Mesorhizobium sp. M0340]|uniref:hypothetical protein n=1 Tax=Mesorhizobium sp. M0340 TaxID=2956939 RepID=UPI00333BB1F9
MLATGKDLKWRHSKVTFSQGTTGASRQKYAVVVVYRGTGLVVTSDHVFLMSDGSLKTADRLAPTDELVSPTGQPVEIESVHIGDYVSGFHHIATVKKEPNKNLDQHLLNTNGVVSGDYSLQLFYKSGEGHHLMADGHEDLPIVGSAEYRRLYGESSLSAPRLRGKDMILLEKNIPDPFSGQFISAEAMKLSIPEDAASFISEEEAEARRDDPKREFNDPAAREWTEALINFYQSFFPQISFQFNWADNTVNAYAWVQNGVRYVAILGGLVRTPAIELEGISLVLAHELAHHYGGNPTFPGGLSCEGQSDYYGMLVNMRKVWFGDQYIAVAGKAIAQMADFFGVPNSPNIPGGHAGCNHPEGSCRIATYYAAVNLQPKPGCAS